MTPKQKLLELADRVEGAEPCERCDDSGYVEFTSGGVWTGENITTRLEVCDCICGQDVLRALASQEDGE